MLPAFMNKVGKAKPRELKPETQKNKAGSTTRQWRKSAGCRLKARLYQSAKSGFPARELNTNEGVPR